MNVASRVREYYNHSYRQTGTSIFFVIEEQLQSDCHIAFGNDTLVC